MLPTDLNKQTIDKPALSQVLQFQASSVEPIVIVGSGPAGAISALGAAAKGHPVIVVSKYSYATRQQRVKLENKTVLSLKKYQNKEKEDTLFFKKLKDNSNTVSIKSLETYLLRKLREEAQKNPQFKWIDHQTAELTAVNVGKTPPELTLTSYEKKNDKASGKNSIKESVTIRFKHLVDASGSSRIAYKLANQDKGTDYQIELAQELQPKHAAQGTAIIHLTDSAQKKLTWSFKAVLWKLFHPRQISRVRLSNKDLIKLTQLKFQNEEGDEFCCELKQKPNIYVIAAKGKSADRSKKMIKKFYVGGDIPEEIVNIKDTKTKQEAIGAWSKQVLAIHLRGLGIKDEDLYRKYDEQHHELSVQQDLNKYQQRFKNSPSIAKKAVKSKKSLAATAFIMKMFRAKQPMDDLLGDGRHLMLAVGESLQNAHFHYAHGVVDAIEQAECFVNCLPNYSDSNSADAFKKAEYQKGVNRLIHAHDQRLASSRSLFNAFCCLFLAWRKTTSSPQVNVEPSQLTNKKSIAQK